MARWQAPGLTLRTVIEKFAAIQMADVYLPTSDGRELVLPRHTQPDDDQRLLPHQLGRRLPEQPPPRTRAQWRRFPGASSGTLVVPSFRPAPAKNQSLA